MAELDLDALEQAARAAGGGCWFSAGWTVGSRGFEVGDLKSRDRICSDATERCAEFIAAANPATILELLDRLKAAEKSDAESLAMYRRARDERDTLRAALRHEADCVEAAKAEIEALRAKIEAMERQEPFDADSDVFRGAFEAALKAGNWPATRQGDGYRSPSTQIAWRIAFSTVNRLKLYLAPVAQGE